MALQSTDEPKIARLLNHDPTVTIFLRPIAAPAALGLAGYAGATWIAASWLARWWGDEDSPGILFPFVAFWGGLAQFIAGIFGFWARDILVTVVYVLWGSFWMSASLLWFLVLIGTIPVHSFYDHYPEVAAWFVVMTFFTWSAAIASIARDLVLFGVLFCLAVGSTIACCLFAYGGGVRTGMKVAAYFWIVSSILAWYRVTVYLMEDSYGGTVFAKMFPLFRLPIERGRPLLVPGLGEPGVKRGMPGVL
ncbi:hypothetical protein EJ06DRAFT_139103 [Trichodelitschia bisporula]|uniref:Uncharacterized protein n=1 Tax=Trichodelitschia bisporula TaxID=703511 RepID=A0A6G1HPL0_9PEZI|nr:hypothetical protein EJ06DRAFT_139103 [Trichodelitschia bisporula]